MQSAQLKHRRSHSTGAERIKTLYGPFRAVFVLMNLFIIIFIIIIISSIIINLNTNNSSFGFVNGICFIIASPPLLNASKREYSCWKQYSVDKDNLKIVVFKAHYGMNR